MCNSKNAESGCCPHDSEPRYPIASSAAPNVTPSRSSRAAAQSRVNAPANTPDATIAGAKREPSSLVQLITSIGA